VVECLPSKNSNIPRLTNKILEVAEPKKQGREAGELGANLKNKMSKVLLPGAQRSPNEEVGQVLWET
jgi:hypothetical protein